MPGLGFPVLAEKFIAALELAGATVLETSPRDQKPLSLSVIVAEQTIRLEVYLWTITQGGKGRNRPTEYRIQRTPNNLEFKLKPGVRTIMGGFHEDTGTFAFWDVRRHLTVGSSQSSQLDLSTLQNASVHGMATQRRQLAVGEETAIAVRPEFLLWYVQKFDDIYEGAVEVPDAASRIEDTPEEQREFIDTGADENAQGRRYKLVEVLRAFRDARFRPRVLQAYGFRCALTGIALGLVDAAHIVPVDEPTSTDETNNGIALVPLLHRAYDNGLLGLLPGGKTAINSRMLKKLTDQKLQDGLPTLRQLVPRAARLPGSPDLSPPDDYFLRGLKARGWTPAEITAARTAAVG